MIGQIVLYLTSIILGMMIFFSFVVAPVTFKLLNEENSRKFVRGIFPFYYLVNFIVSFIACALLVYLGDMSSNFYLMVAVCILFAISKLILMPLINKLKDAGKEKSFKIYHFISVLINFVQMIFLILILA
tara:strand:- start:323 stop:712 length:390 start_codon:yes stop_codon:yes gene_type:complete